MDLSGTPRALSIPLGVVYVGGRGSYQPEVGAGLAIIPAYWGDYWLIPYPYVGFRYESPNGPLFRIGVAGLIDGDGPPAVYPVPGLSYGWRF